MLIGVVVNSCRIGVIKTERESPNLFVNNPVSVDWGSLVLEIPISTGFFLTPAAEKTKTQAQNSRKKLKEKTQPQGGTFLLLRETQEKNSISPKLL